jgi:hypothetical protein
MSHLLAIYCELNVPGISSIRLSSSPITRSPGFRPIIANTHSVFATFCELNDPGYLWRRAHMLACLVRFEGDQVLGIRLRIVIHDKDLGLAHVVNC